MAKNVHVCDMWFPCVVRCSGSPELVGPVLLADSSGIAAHFIFQVGRGLQVGHVQGKHTKTVEGSQGALHRTAKLMIQEVA